jgi:hypothetical protein
MSVGTKGIQIGRFGLAELRITSLQSRIIVKVNVGSRNGELP